MNDQNTEAMNGKRPFEERVFARFDALDLSMRDIYSRLDTVDSRLENVDSRLLNVDSRLHVLEIRAYDTKPIWEQALKEIVETRREIVDTRRELSKRLDRIEGIVFQNRADLRYRRSS